jgi:hypothetical protein
VGSALAASAYTQPWSGSSTEGWEGNTISSVVVHDAGVGNPAGSIASRYDSRPAAFDIGFTSGNGADTSGSFSGTPWNVSFDLQLNEGKFSDAWLRYRYQDFNYNGWRYALLGPFDQYDTWTHYDLSFDPSWSDAQAMANGWTQESGPVVSFAQTMSSVYKTEVRLALTDSTSSALVHLDNFVQAPVPEPQTWALMLGGLLMLGTLARRRAN